jgi:hypothetical protein
MTATVNGVEQARDHSLRGSIDRLEHLVTEAEAGRIEAQRAYETSQAGAINLPEVVALREHHEGIIYRKPGADTDPDKAHSPPAAPAGGADARRSAHHRG